MRFATIALCLMTGACVPPLPGGSLDTGAGGAAGSTSVSTGGKGGVSAPSARGGSPGSGAIAGSAFTGGGGSGGMPTPGGPPPNLGGWPGPGETTGSAGTSGADAGLTCAAPRCTPHSCMGGSPRPSAVSGFESQCSDLAPVDGRDGAWFVYATGPTMTDPSPNEPFRVACDGAFGSCYASCIRGTLSGSGYPTAGIGFVPVKDYKAYDVSAYRGIGFSLFVGNVPPSASFRVQVPLVADQDPAYGGTCTTNCFNTYQAPLPNLPSGWMRYEIDFAQLAQQPGWGTPEPWDPTTVLSVQWVVASPNETIPYGTFFYCVDDVSFIPR